MDLNFPELEGADADILRNIDVLATKQHVAKYKMAKDLGISRSSIQNWNKTGSYPTVDKIYKIARYLDTTVEFLMTGEESKSKAEEQKILEDFNKLSPDCQHLVRELMLKLKDK